MATGPETRFYTSIHRLLKKSGGVYMEKMHNPFSSGTPDVWYSGNADDLWVEYKWLNKVPARTPIRVYKSLSERQLLWLRERRKEGRNVAVALGTPEGAWLFEHGSWLDSLPQQEFRQHALTKKQLASEIRRRVCLYVPEIPDLCSTSD